MQNPNPNLPAVDVTSAPVALNVDRAGTQIVDAVIDGNVGSAMLECLVLAAPRTKSAQTVAPSKALARALTASRRKHGFAAVTVYGAGGKPVACATVSSDLA